MAFVEVVTQKLNFLREMKCKVGIQHCKFLPADDRQANSNVNVSPLDQCLAPAEF